MTKPAMPSCAFLAKRPINAPDDLVETDEGFARAMKFIGTHENPFDRLNGLCWIAERIKNELRKRELRIRRLTARIENSRGDRSETNKNEVANARRLIASIKSGATPYNTRLATVLDLFASIRKDVLDGLLSYTEDFASSIPDGCQETRDASYSHDIASTLGRLVDIDFSFKNPRKPRQRRSARKGA